MDIHLHSNPPLHYGLNGCHQAPHPKYDGLQFLSLEEKESILFFDGTIDALEEGLEDDKTESSSRRTPFIADCQTPFGPTVPPISRAAVPHSVIEHDIIDLVHTTPDYSMPDFQSLATRQEPHIEIKPKKDPVESIFSDFPDSATAMRSMKPEESTSHQPPPGSVPTPVVIASKIAEQQGGPPATTSALLEGRRSLESKCGPPTHAKPTRLADNISLKQASREVSHHSIALEAVNTQERRSQMLASLPASAHPLDGGEPACIRNLPTRSVSFLDPTPDKSRMEALSMLGLMRAKTATAVTTHVPSTKMESNGKRTSNTTATASNNCDTPNFISTSITGSGILIGQKKNSSAVVTPYSHSGRCEPKAKSDIAASNINSYGGKSAAVTPANADPVGAGNGNRRPSPATPPSTTDVTRSDFNSYGGKSIVLNPSANLKADVSGPGLKQEPSDIHLNNYGGKSRVIHPSVQADPPPGSACRPNSHSHSPSSTVTPATHHNLHNVVQSKIFPPAKTDFQKATVPISNRNEAHSDLISANAKPTAATPSHPDPVSQPLGRTRLATAPPTLAPRPQRSTGSMNAYKPRSETHSQEIRSKPAPKPSFCTQGITVQFSGKGATDEARRDALRKLGLLKNT